MQRRCATSDGGRSRSPRTWRDRPRRTNRPSVRTVAAILQARQLQSDRAVTARRRALATAPCAVDGRAGHLWRPTCHGRSLQMPDAPGGAIRPPLSPEVSGRTLGGHLVNVNMPESYGISDTLPYPPGRTLWKPAGGRPAPRRSAAGTASAWVGWPGRWPRKKKPEHFSNLRLHSADVLDTLPIPNIDAHGESTLW